MWVNKTYQLKRSMSQSFTLFLFESISAPIFKASQAVGKLGSSNSGIERSQLKKLINETVNQQLSSLDNKADRNSLEFIFYTKFYFLLVNFSGENCRFFICCVFNVYSNKKLRFSFFFLIVYSVNFIQYFSAFEDRRKIVEFS